MRFGAILLCILAALPLIAARHEPGIRGKGRSLTTCSDIPDWYDSDGSDFDCDWYASSLNAYDIYGHSLENFGHTASSACCACGGGEMLKNSLENNPLQFGGHLFGPGFQQYEMIEIDKFDEGMIDVEEICHPKCAGDPECTGFQYRVDDRFDGRTNGNCWFMTGEIKHVPGRSDAGSKFGGVWIKEIQTFSYDGATGASLQEQCDAARAEGRRGVTCCNGSGESGVSNSGCEYSGHFGISGKAVGVIAENACAEGDSSCDYFLGTAMGGSCQGYFSCFYQKGFVGLGGCVGNAACYYHKGSVGTNSCTFADACGESTANIGANACQGPCSCLGNKDETIAAGTCNSPCECADKNSVLSCKYKGYGGRCDE